MAVFTLPTQSGPVAITSAIAPFISGFTLAQAGDEELSDLTSP